MQDSTAAARTRADFAAHQAAEIYTVDRDFADAMATAATDELDAIRALTTVYARREATMTAYEQRMTARLAATRQKAYDARVVVLPVDQTNMDAYVRQLEEESRKSEDRITATRMRTGNIVQTFAELKPLTEAERDKYAREHGVAVEFARRAEFAKERELTTADRLARAAEDAARASEAERVRREQKAIAAAEVEHKRQIAARKAEEAARALAEKEESEAKFRALSSPPASPGQPPPTPSVPAFAMPSPLSPVPAASLPPTVAIYRPADAPTPVTYDPVPTPVAPAVSSKPRPSFTMPTPPAGTDRRELGKHVSTLRVAFTYVGEQVGKWITVVNRIHTQSEKNRLSVTNEGYPYVHMPELEGILRVAKAIASDDAKYRAANVKYRADVLASHEALGDAAFSSALANTLVANYDRLLAALDALAAIYRSAVVAMDEALTFFKKNTNVTSKANSVQRRTQAKRFWDTYHAPVGAVHDNLADMEKTFAAVVVELQRYYDTAVAGSGPVASIAPPPPKPTPSIAPPPAPASPGADATMNAFLEHYPAVRPLIEDISAYIIRVEHTRMAALDTWVTLIRDVTTRVRASPPPMSDDDIGAFLHRAEVANSDHGEAVKRLAADRRAFEERARAITTIQKIDDSASVFTALDGLASVVQDVDAECERYYQLVAPPLLAAEVALAEFVDTTALSKGTKEYDDALAAQVWAPYLHTTGFATDAPLHAAEQSLASWRRQETETKEAIDEMIHSLPEVEGAGRTEPAAKRVQSEMTTPVACPACARRPVATECLSTRTNQWVGVCRDTRCIEKVRGGY